MPRASVNGIELAYETYGAGPPLVLAHGLAASKEMWDGQIGPFSERYCVVVYDTRGHGESSAPPADDSGYTLDTFVEDQRGLMEQLGIEQAYVGGLSMGGMIAMRLALAYPKMVRALLLCDTSAGGAAMSAVTRQIQANRPLVETLVRSFGLTALARTIYGRMESAGVGAKATMPAGIQNHMGQLQNMTADGFLGAGRALADQASVQDRLREISVPTLIITGEQDFMRGPSEEMKQLLPDARFVLIKDSYHGTSMWQPEKFTAAVLDFLGDVEASRPVAGKEER
ncbi:MAG: alpha/beta fold hydrolase [Dehalococcoidia bacterium]